MDYEEIESSQRQFHNDMLYQIKLDTTVMEQQYLVFSMLKPKLYKDGNKWCCLYGDDLQTGIAGFGDTPFEAMTNWNAEWNKK